MVFKYLRPAGLSLPPLLGLGLLVGSQQNECPFSTSLIASSRDSFKGTPYQNAADKLNPTKASARRFIDA